MAPFTTLRALGLLRRGVRALEHMAASLATLERIDQDRWERERPTHKGRPADIGTLDISAANRRWRAQQVAAGVEDEEPSV